ncbi:MAG: AMP-binding protein [Spirochaetaceae bacterium]|jgi:acetyl-CoA synthetase|nr:AMP-binding protein [Spirochaetaceae bacterium]
MSELLKKFLPREEFTSYDDFYRNYTVNMPENFNFGYHVMDCLARIKPEERALVWCDEKGAEASFTYAEIKTLSNQAANVLRGAGIGKGDPVMLILKRRWEYWPVLLALHKLGAISIPATHLLTSKDIVYRCNAASIKALICVDEEKIMSSVEEAEKKLREEGAQTPGILSYKAFIRSAHSTGAPGGAAEKGWIDFKPLMEGASEDLAISGPVNANNDIMLLYFTSGTTGMPKMVQHNFVYPLGHIVTAKYWHQVQEGGLHLTVADTGWAKAAWGKIYGQWLCESAVFVYDYDRFVPPAMLDVVVKYKVSTFCAPPTVYRFFIKEDLSRWDFSTLRSCTVAGEPLEPEIYEQFKEGTGIKLRECYGQTELTVTCCNYPWLKPKPGSMGKPSPGYHIDLIRDDGSSCEMGEEGQMVVRTDKRQPWGMFGGYYRDEELTRSVWHDGIYYTGDMAWRDEDGFLWFVGRADDVIKSSGYRIGPFEVESALMEHPAVLECAITGVPDPDRGKAVKATVVLAKGWSPSEELKKELQNHVKKITAPYKYPRIVEFVAELPKTISGKIRRVQIREEDSAR